MRLLNLLSLPRHAWASGREAQLCPKGPVWTGGHRAVVSTGWGPCAFLPHTVEESTPSWRLSLSSVPSEEADAT